MLDISNNSFGIGQILVSFFPIYLFSLHHMGLMKIYPDDSLKHFDFEKIKNLIALKCQNSNAKELALKLKPKTNLPLITDNLNKTEELVLALKQNKKVPTFAYPNLNKAFGRMAIEGAVLDEKDFMNIKHAAEKANQCITYYYQNKVDYPYLYSIVKEADRSKDIINLIDSVFENTGIVKDNASAELLEIRTDLSSKRQKANRLFLNAIRKYKKLGYLLEFNESYYNNRRVLAVFSEHKRDISGIIHGSSETGKTTYLEPGTCVEVNNQIAVLEQKERREVHKILSKLTKEIIVYKPIIEEFVLLLDELDFVEARAKFAIEIEASKPQVSKDNTLTKLDVAYHPLLFLQNKKEGKKTIPLNIVLNKEQHIVIISGPNAGGKSIALKTLGLLQIMFQCGLMVSAESSSEFKIFNHLLVDIGDDQSIEAELSTYSSRLKKMKFFIRIADEQSLFLIDEFGTGSDPEMGGAMAESILEELYEKKSAGIVTTHYSNIKIIGEKLTGVQNASMLFNKNNLAPLYELRLGEPGSSYTFEVAQKVGIGKEIISRAKSKLNNKKLRLDKLLSNLQEERRKLERLNQKHQVQSKEFRELKDKYETKLSKLETKTEENRKKLEESHRQFELGEKYQKSIDKYIQGNAKKKDLLKSFEMVLDAELLKKKKDEERKRMHKKSLKKQKPKQEETLNYLLQKMKPGVKVKLKNQKTVGIVESVNGRDITVAFNLIKMKVDIEELRLVFSKS